MALFAAIGGEIVKHLWNGCCRPLFGFRTITFWQGVAASGPLPQSSSEDVGMRGSMGSRMRRAWKSAAMSMTPRSGSGSASAWASAGACRAVEAEQET
jgi:hypothetical protein